MTDEQQQPPNTDQPRKPMSIVEWDEKWNDVAWQRLEDEIDRYRTAHQQDMHQHAEKLEQFKRQVDKMEQQLQETPNDELSAELAQFKVLIAQAEEALQAEEKSYQDTFDAYCDNVQRTLYAEIQKIDQEQGKEQ